MMGNSHNCQPDIINNTKHNTGDKNQQPKVIFTDEELKSRLTPLQYHVTQQKGTERFVPEKKPHNLKPITQKQPFRAFTGEYAETRDPGDYQCVVCEEKLFESDSKFNSHCGWPAFTAPLSKDKIDHTEDYSHSKNCLH